MSEESAEYVTVSAADAQSAKPEEQAKEKALTENRKPAFFKEEALPDETRLIGEEYLKNELDRPLGIVFYFFLPLLMLLPVINLVVFSSWTFGKYVNTNKRRIGIASFIWIALIIFVMVFFGDTVFMLLSDVYESIKGK